MKQSDIFQNLILLYGLAIPQLIENIHKKVSMILNYEKYFFSEFINTMITVTHAIKQRFPDVLVIPVLGNHDMEPSNSFPDDTEQLGMYRHIYYLWQEWIGDEPEV